MRQNASWSNNENCIAEGVLFAFAPDEPVARRKCELHAVRKADDHDERRHHVQECVQLEVEPAERPLRQKDRYQRRGGRDNHERKPPEKNDRDQAAGGEADAVVEELIAFDGVANLQAHDGHAGKLSLEAGALQIPAIVFRIAGTTSATFSLSATSGSSAITTSASFPSSDNSLPRMLSFDRTRSI